MRASRVSPSSPCTNNAPSHATRHARVGSAGPLWGDMVREMVHMKRSGTYQQPWTFVATSDPDTKHRIRVAAEAEERENYEGGRLPDAWRDAIAPLGTTSDKSYLDVVPWIVVVFAQKSTPMPDGTLRKNYYVNESVGIACGLFITSLHTMGLATLTHTPNPMGFLTEIFQRPPTERPYILFPVGHPSDDCEVPDLQRKPLDASLIFFPSR